MDVSCHTELEIPHTFVAGSERALGLLRRALGALPGFFISHLPVEGPGCVEILKRSERRMLWMSPWAVSHAQYVAAHLERACFVVITGAEEAASIPRGCRWLQLSEAALSSAPRAEVKRLVRFLREQH
ncbi:MAG: hypothetical protein Q8S33_18490 [Myxococcales bacterium]|nr:hypothetical protein [Myxococcales bacterium]